MFVQSEALRLKCEWIRCKRLHPDFTAISILRRGCKNVGNKKIKDEKHRMSRNVFNKPPYLLLSANPEVLRPWKRQKARKAVQKSLGTRAKGESPSEPLS
jgi:hypothetical protein